MHWALAVARTLRKVSSGKSRSAGVFGRRAGFHAGDEGILELTPRRRLGAAGNGDAARARAAVSRDGRDGAGAGDDDVDPERPVAGGRRREPLREGPGQP